MFRKPTKHIDNPKNNTSESKQNVKDKLEWQKWNQQEVSGRKKCSYILTAFLRSLELITCIPTTGVY